MRRFWKTPTHIVERYRELLRTTDYSAHRCAQIAKLKNNRLGAAIAKEERRYISAWRWVVKATGEIRPVANPCPTACAVRKTGMSAKTLQRRIQEGTLHAERVASHGTARIFDPAELIALRETGMYRPESWSQLTKLDVETIRERALAGETHTSIARDYPVSRRQISRIVDGTRWRRP